MRYHSHFGHDQWVAETFNFRRDAYFLDFGAFDGVTASNTLALERDLGWRGIAVEANPTYYPSLCRSRSCITINAALWRNSRRVVEMVNAHGLSCVADHINFDGHERERQDISKGHFNIETISPNDLLRRFDAPDRIEYLSLDIEGCEAEVLKSIDLGYYQIALMSIEHSHVPERQTAIRRHLLPLGYEVFERFHDDWFFHRQYLADRQLPNETFDPVRAFERVCNTYVIE